MRVRIALRAVCLPFALIACNAILGNDGWTPQSTRAPDAGDAADLADGSTTNRDAAAQRDTSAGTDAGPTSDTSAPPDTSVVIDSGSGLDPCLVLPALDAAACTPVGNPTVCALGECLIATPGVEGRCQQCKSTSSCSGHADAPCAVAEDCDIGWACYCGACTLMCPLMSPTFCGSSTCTNVGNFTEGVCLPPN